MAEYPTIRYVLYADLESTGRWVPESSPAERSQVSDHFNQYFKRICDRHHPLPDSMSARGDDFLIWFESHRDAVSAGLELLQHASDQLTRTNPFPRLLIRPRLIAFAADVCCESDFKTASSPQVDNIMPVERKIGKVGYLVICERLQSFLDGDQRAHFDEDEEALGKTIGKRGAVIQTYKTRTKCDFPEWPPQEEVTREKERKRNFTEALYVIMGYNILSRNMITTDLIREVKRANRLAVDGEWFVQNALEAFRLFLESVVQTPSDGWTFKLSLWEKTVSDSLTITHLAYPNGMKSKSHDEGARVRIGSNLVGKAWKEQKTLLIPEIGKVKAALYKPLHKAREVTVCSMAAFPVLLQGKSVGVVCVDTNVLGFYEPQGLDEGFHTTCASSFTNNLAFGLLLKQMTKNGAGAKKHTGRSTATARRGEQK